MEESQLPPLPQQPAERLQIVACPSCGGRFKVRHPGRAVTSIFTCPKCNNKFKVNFKAPEQPTAEPALAAINVGVAQSPASQAEPVEDQKTRRAGDVMPTWTVSTRPPSAVLRVYARRKFLPCKVLDFKIEGYGVTIIGRTDATAISDINVPGDSAMSRRSAQIEIVNQPSGAVFFFKVRKAANPVYVNDRELAPGEAVELNFGDRIVMGRTKMLFTDK